MSGQTFDRDVIQAEYERLGYSRGWSFMATPERALREAQVAFVGLDPGGGGDADKYEYGELWDFPEGNAYFMERWGPKGTETAIQRQVWRWHELLEIGAHDSLCAQFVPFRSPGWDALKRKGEALAFGRRLWTWVLSVSPATLFVTMGKEPARQLASITGARHVAQLPTGWRPQIIDVWDTADGRRIVGMPHPSRYTLFGRANSASELAEESFRAATER